jgi:hypothetical protein
MLPFGVTIPATVQQGSEIPEGLMNNPVLVIAVTECWFEAFASLTKKETNPPTQLNSKAERFEQHFVY